MALFEQGKRKKYLGNLKRTIPGVSREDVLAENEVDDEARTQKEYSKSTKSKKGSESKKYKKYGY